VLKTLQTFCIILTAQSMQYSSFSHTWFRHTKHYRKPSCEESCRIWKWYWQWWFMI
jgi:hypothetical protein